MGCSNNNFNSSTSGINIECNIFKDQFLSQINFDENIERSENFDKYFVYKDYGNIDHKLKYNVSKIDLNDLFIIDDTEVNQNKFKEFMLNELDYEFNDDYFIMDELNNHLYYSDLDDIINIISCSGIDYKQLYEIISVSGYSQGDYAEVIILTEVLKNIWGLEEINLDNLTDEITHYFYDAPMTVRLTINDQEFYSEKYDGMYEEWNKLEYEKEVLINEVMEYFKEDKFNLNILHNELIAIIPEEINYAL